MSSWQSQQKNAAIMLADRLCHHPYCFPSQPPTLFRIGAGRPPFYGYLKKLHGRERSENKVLRLHMGIELGKSPQKKPLANLSNPCSSK